MFKNIVLATDGSTNAKRATAMAADLAAACGARLTLVTVLSRFMMLEDIEAMPQVRKLPRSARDEMKRIREMIARSTSDIDTHAYIPALPSLTRALGDAILDEAESIAAGRKAGKVARIVVAGDAATQILKQATKAKADLIVMGTRGMSNFRGFLIGSVSNKVVHSSKCATLLIK